MTELSKKEQELKRDLQLNSIHYYRNNGSDHVFVYNDSSKHSPQGTSSIVIIPLNENSTLRIPNTRLPIDLTEQAPKEEVINNKLFMDLIFKKILRICSDEEAFDVRSDPAAIAELNKLAEGNVNQNLDKMYDRKEIEVKEGDLVDSTTPAKLEVNLTVMEILAREDISQDEKISTVKNLASTLTEKDWKYIFENSQDDLKDLALENLK